MVLHHIFTPHQVSLRFLHLPLVFKLTQDVGKNAVKVFFHPVEQRVHEFLVDRECVQSLVQFTVELFNVLALFFVAESDGDSMLACSSCSSDSMEIPLGLSWETKVDDCFYIRNIKTPSNQIGCDKDINAPNLELLHS